MCVVYEIRNAATGDTYIGSAVDGRKRWSEHRKALRDGLHSSKALLRDWKHYGESAFTFTVIHDVREPYAIEMMRLLEIAYIHERQPTYNSKYPPGYVLMVSPGRGYARDTTGSMPICTINPRHENDNAAGIR